MYARLPHRFLLGLDRSAVAVARSAERNRTHLESGRLELRQGAVEDLEVLDGSFDLACCLDANVFWTVSAAAELDRLHRALRPGGRLHVMYGPAPGDFSAALETVRRHLAASPFAGAEVRRTDRGSEVRATRAD